MKCPAHREQPPAWYTEDDDGTPTSYIIRNPLGGGAGWVSMPLTGFYGLPVVAFHVKKPPDAERFTCPLQNDEAYLDVARAVAESAIGYGYYPDTRGPLVEGEGSSD